MVVNGFNVIWLICNWRARSIRGRDSILDRYINALIKNKKLVRRFHSALSMMFKTGIPNFRLVCSWVEAICLSRGCKQALGARKCPWHSINHITAIWIVHHRFTLIVHLTAMRGFDFRLSSIRNLSASSMLSQ